MLDALAMIPDSLGYFQVIIAVNLAAGVTGSSSGGLSIALDSLSDRFLNVLNLNPEAVHRIACISSGGLDSLPCNGTVLNELAMAKLPPRVGYRPMFVLTVITPILTSCLIGLVATFIGGLSGPGPVLSRREAGYPLLRKKQRRPSGAAVFVAYVCDCPNQPWEMAPVGQVSAQEPQSMQVLASMTY